MGERSGGLEVQAGVVRSAANECDHLTRDAGNRVQEAVGMKWEYTNR